jgi:cytochrome c oxidase cbb3-type subunit 2
MKGLYQLFFGLFATFAFSWIGLALIPNAQIGHLDPQMDEEGTDIYPMPPSGMAVRGRKVYTANGCFYCHSQQVRPAYVAADIERKWGNRRSAPRDYVFNRPDLLGRMRMGPDLANIGQRAPAEDQNAPGPGASPAASPAAAVSSATAGAKPAAAASPSPSPTLDSGAKPDEPATYSAAWHHHHLYSPRMVDVDSNMPAYRFLYEKRRISGERSADALNLTGADAPPDGYEIVPSYEAKCLVAYLMSLDQSHPLKEVKSLGGASAAPGKGTGK